MSAAAKKPRRSGRPRPGRPKGDTGAAAVRRCFDRIAADPHWHAFTADERRRIDAFIRRWKIRPGDRVLEPGCGSGRLTAILADLTGRSGTVLAFDASPVFMRLARRRGLPAQVTLRCGTVASARFARDSFDHVVCFNVFPHLVPHLAAARRLAAALKPGGVFWIAHTGSRRFVNDMHRGGPPAIRAHLLPAPGPLARLLREAGLSEVEIEDGAHHFLARAVRPPHAPASPNAHVRS